MDFHLHVHQNHMSNLERQWCQEMQANVKAWKILASLLKQEVKQFSLCASCICCMLRLIKKASKLYGSCLLGVFATPNSRRLSSVLTVHILHSIIEMSSEVKNKSIMLCILKACFVFENFRLRNENFVQRILVVSWQGP